MENLFLDIIKFAQILLIPAMLLMYKYMKRQITIANDIRDLKTFVIAICEKLKITCTLKDG